MSANQITTLCGTPTRYGFKDGIGKEAQFHSPTGLVLHEREKLLYISDSRNHVIRSMNLIDGRVTTIIGKEELAFYGPKGLALDSTSNSLYMADEGNHSIKKILLKERKVETLCGGEYKEYSGYRDGSFKEVLFNAPFDVTLNSKTQELYVSDAGNHAIRLLSLNNKTVKTLCGTPGVRGYENGIATQSKFQFPGGLTLDNQSQCLYVTDYNYVIRKISLLDQGRVSTFCGTPGDAGSKDGLFPSFNSLEGIVFNSHSHTFYVMDCREHKVRKIIDRKKALTQ